jgi:hypothetical protein
MLTSTITLPFFISFTISSVTTMGVRPCSGRSAPMATSALRKAFVSSSGWITLVHNALAQIGLQAAQAVDALVEDLHAGTQAQCGARGEFAHGALRR